MIIINVPQDGNCLFRCIHMYLNPKYTLYERFKNGKIKKKRLNFNEYENSSKLRFNIVTYLENNKQDYDNITFDDDYYNTLEERIEKMKNNTEFGGLIEIDCASKLFNIGIDVYVDNNKSKFNKIASFNPKKRKKCKLLLEDEHYNLII